MQSKSKQPGAPRRGALSISVWLALCFAFAVGPLAYSSSAYQPTQSLKLLIIASCGSMIALVSSLYLCASANKVQFRLNHFDIIVGLSLLFAAASLMFSQSPYLGSQQFIQVLSALGIYLVVSNGIIDNQSVSVVAGFCFFSSFVNSVVVLSQNWFAVDTFLQGAPPAGLFGNRNNSAQFIAYTLPFGLLLMQKLKNRAVLFTIALLLGVNLAALMASYARSAIIATSLIVVIFPLIAKFIIKHPLSGIVARRHVASAGISLIVAIGLICVPSHESMTSTSKGLMNKANDLIAASGVITGKGNISASIDGRLELVRNSFFAFKDNPLGYGLGNWPAIYPKYANISGLNNSDVSKVHFFAHNFYIEKVVELGVFGVLFVVLFAFSFILVTYASLRSPLLGLSDKLAVTCAFCSSLIIFSTAAFSMPLNYAVGPFVLALNLGWILHSFNSISSQARNGQISQKSIGTVKVLCIRVLAVCLAGAMAFTLLNAAKQFKADQWFAKCHLAFTKGNFDDALRFANKTLEIDPNHYRANTRAHLILRSHNIERAHNHLVIIEQYYPMMPNNLGLLAYSFTAQKKFDRAIEYWKKFITIMPGNETAHRELVGIHASRKDYKLCIPHLKELIRIDPSNRQYLMSLANINALIE